MKDLNRMQMTGRLGADTVVKTLEGGRTVANFSIATDESYKDKDGKEKYCWITCYGPATSRIFASIVIVHGDDKGLRFPWKIAPLQIVIVPIRDDEKIM